MNRGRQRTQRVAGAAFMIGLAVTSSVGAEEKRPAVAKQGGQILGSFMTGGVMSTPLVVEGKVIAGALDNRLLVVAE